MERLKVQRKDVFEFTQKPTVTRDGDTVTISFTVKGCCDATIAIEESGAKVAGTPRGVRGPSASAPSPRILRHLACGVLGPNAPEPLQKDSLKQTIVWDGKDDLGIYIDDKDGLGVRISLGLDPRLERTMFWDPKKRLGLRMVPRVVAQPEGVYVYEGAGVETVRLFDHDGRYIRMICPFPARDVEKVRGLPWNTFTDGHKAPRHRGTFQESYADRAVGSGGSSREPSRSATSASRKTGAWS